MATETDNPYAKERFTSGHRSGFPTRKEKRRVDYHALPKKESALCLRHGHETWEDPPEVVHYGRAAGLSPRPCSAWCRSTNYNRSVRGKYELSVCTNLVADHDAYDIYTDSASACVESRRDDEDGL